MKKNLLIPDYIYSSRTSDMWIEFFENQYLKQVDFYDPEIADHPDKKEYGKRIGYSFFRDLRARLEKEPEIAPARIVELGNSGFSWRYLSELMDAKSEVLAFGIGSDISFEEALTETVGCSVHCFDPTPGALEYAVPIMRRNPSIHLHPIGIFSRDDVVRFYKPQNKGGSLSATNLTYGTVYLEAPVRRLQTIMRQLGIAKVDYLKIDIEGAEHGVIEDLLFSDLNVVQIGVEFDQPTPPWKIEATMRKLLLAGYVLASNWGLNCLFVRRDALAASVV